MISICVELRTTCNSCGNPLPLNALSETIHCNSCQKDTSFTYEYWRYTIIESVFENGLSFKEGAGQDQTNMSGEHNFNMTYGNQHAQCRKCKTQLDYAQMDEYAKAGSAKCTKCGNDVTVRYVPKEAVHYFEGVKYLVGEDTGQIVDENDSAGSVSKSKLIIFTCPSCAGSLEIDGTARVVTCKYCSNEIYLPDDLWLRLHPVKTVERWYLVFDEKLLMQGLQKWEDINWVTADKDSNLYAISKRGMDNTVYVWSFGPDLKTRWIRNDLKYNISKAGLSVTSGGVVLLFDPESHSLLKLSASDGKTIGIMAGQAPTPQNPNSFDVSDCKDIIADSDGSVIALYGNMLHRYSDDLLPLPLWGDPHAQKSEGFFSSIIKKISGDSDSEIDAGSIGVKELGSRPAKINADGIFMQAGLDGYLYFMDNENGGEDLIAKYSKNGDKLGTYKIPLDEKYNKQFIDAAGNIYVLGTTLNTDDYVNLVKYNIKSAQWEIAAKDIMEGGVIRDSDIMVGTPDGKLYIFGSDNNLRILDLSFKMIYISDEAKRDDKDALDDK